MSSQILIPRNFKDFPDYLRYWGKARASEGEHKPYFHLLAYHSLDVAAVGHLYLERAPALLDWLSEKLGGVDREVLRSWVTFCLALHDIGKFSRSFQSQRPDILTQLWGIVKTPNPSRHDDLGMRFWLNNLDQVQEWLGDSAGIEYWIRAVTGHHGQPPAIDGPQFSILFPRPNQESAWKFLLAARELLLTEQVEQWVLTADAEVFEKVSTQVSWWIAGVAVLADWIGSNADLFQYCDQPFSSLDAYWEHALAIADQALSESGVIPPIRYVSHSFQSLFPAITQPSPLQQWAMSVELLPGPQIYLLEDVTGAGKTEAAMMLTQRLMAENDATGFFIALPTMATANAMYGRMAEVYDRMFPTGLGGGMASMVLAHGRKTLVEEFAASVVRAGADNGNEGYVEKDEDSQTSATERCTRWLADHNKRALLAPVGVGTIDQALLGALQSKHQSLRLLGLMKKVLVIDEVHACDAYMQEILEKLLELHAYAGGSAVLLSATLTQKSKTALLQAFAKGCSVEESSIRATQDAYPLVTAWAQHTGQLIETPIATREAVSRTVKVRYQSNLDEVIQGIVSALNQGQCVAWVRNTVGDALTAMQLLKNRVAPENITLFHSRFTLGDRLAIEEKVLDTFGPNSAPATRAGRLLIATQVVEQSLDVDFDLVVSDLAPIDRLIQRAGRLHRHTRNQQGERSQIEERGDAVLWVYGPQWTETPEASWFKAVLPKAAFVYEDASQLWLTAKLLQTGSFTMPQDARTMIETVFGGNNEVPAALQLSADKSEGKARAEESHAMKNCIQFEQGYTRSGLAWSAEAVAPSRLGEATHDVLVGRWVDGRIEPWHTDKGQHAWVYSTVRVPKRLIAEHVPEPKEKEVIVQALLEQLPSAGKWAVLLLLNQDTGQASMCAQDGAQIIWGYDAVDGLVKLPT